MIVRTRGRSALTLAAAAAIVLSACSGSDDTSEIDEANARADAAAAETAELTSQLEAAEEANTEAEANAAEAEQQLADAEAANEDLTAEVAVETERADTAEAQLQEIADAFPIEVESTLAGIELELAGTYSISWAEAYCDGFTTCGTLPTVAQATFTRTPDDFLRLEVPGILDAGLFSIDGSLYGITDSFTALPACPDGTERRARITITAYSDNVVIERDLSREVVRLGSSITVDAPDLPGCAGGLVFYGAELTPTG